MSRYLPAGIVLAVFFGSVWSAAAGVAPTPSPTELPPPRCGDGVRDPHFEDCDDGNLFDGDGCGSGCRTEAVLQYRFQPVVRDAYPGVGGPGQLTLSGAAVKAFTLEPIGVPQTGILCVRGVVPFDERFGPNNVGRGGFRRFPGSVNIITAQLFVQDWLNPSIGTVVDVGPDQVPCTEDDPGFPMALEREEELQLSVVQPEPCTGDRDGDGIVTVDELVEAVANALNGCGMGQ
jgi:cysteine-rich repeat protein